MQHEQNQEKKNGGQPYKTWIQIIMKYEKRRENSTKEMKNRQWILQEGNHLWRPSVTGIRKEQKEDCMSLCTVPENMNIFKKKL